MIKQIARLLMVLSFVFVYFQSHSQTTYYVDNLIGSDINDGLSGRKPFKSIEKINQLLLEAGDSVLFRRGGSWTGNLIPRGSGSQGKRIVVGAYGNGPAPVLDAQGKIAEREKVSNTIRLFNQEFIEIRDLKIKNFKSFEVPRQVKGFGNSIAYVNSAKNGIYIEGKDCGTLHDIHLINLEICDINGDMSTKHNGGIFAEITWHEDESKRVRSNFQGLYTEGCYIHHVDRTGWSNMSVWWNRSVDSQWGDKLADGNSHNWFPSHNIILRNNKFERSGANALIVRVAIAPLVEHNFFTHNGWKGSGNASFPFNCDDALFQYNEACYTVFNSEADSWNNRKDDDAGGFDSDWKCKNTIIQYNYSHNNGYGGLLVCNDGNNRTGFNHGTIIRYNIFEDNGHHAIRTAGKTSNTKIYNNVIYSGEEMDSVMLIYHKSWGGFADSTAYFNNIVYSNGKGNHIDLGKSTGNIFNSNIFFGLIENAPTGDNNTSKNPLFKGNFKSENNWQAVLRFMLQDESPAINSGIKIDGHPKEDYLGNPIEGKPDKGAFESFY